MAWLNYCQKSEEYNLKQQLKRAVVAVALNIAEGKSCKTVKDFAHFLNMSVASLAEVEAILTICEELNFLRDIENIYQDTETLGKMLNSFKSKLIAREAE
ncbi:MAG TPA: four helix bundle protein [Candidatus Wunengus sp. YC60]|uniref:four helix bundle protein n=1 Tax=Candidatus Wunengus sp. YC60 TaxID=3367697 RepID=UPI00402645AB